MSEIQKRVFDNDKRLDIDNDLYDIAFRSIKLGDQIGIDDVVIVVSDISKTEATIMIKVKKTTKINFKHREFCK